MARLTFPSCAGAAIGTKGAFILVMMIGVMGCAAPYERPDDEASAEAALALPFLASTQASSPFENDRIDPSLDDSLALIDQLTEDLVALTDEAILTHAANRDLDPVVTPPSPEIDPMTHGENQPPFDDIASFQATTEVQCFSGICAGTTLKGTSDVEINIHTLQALVDNLYASDATGRFVLSGDLRREVVYDHLQSLAQADMVLTVEDEVYVMDEAAGLYIDQHLAETGILEGGFDLRHTDSNTRLIGDLTN